ncbi:hypothetical protein H2203_003608 [Taxawa tesnikishii (nom. ined.)]|nr:hypothetical protein H2203_003608 [Dothideales sp. JES 119]
MSTPPTPTIIITSADAPLGPSAPSSPVSPFSLPVPNTSALTSIESAKAANPDAEGSAQTREFSYADLNSLKSGRVPLRVDTAAAEGVRMRKRATRGQNGLWQPREKGADEVRDREQESRITDEVDVGEERKPAHVRKASEAALTECARDGARLFYVFVVTGVVGGLLGFWVTERLNQLYGPSRGGEGSS